MLKLLHFLVKFGYYGDTSDIQKLQEPLLSLLDGLNDLPFILDTEQTKKKGRFWYAIVMRLERDDCETIELHLIGCVTIRLAIDR